jgi:uncharacterized delta-60 repeat protein
VNRFAVAALGVLLLLAGEGSAAAAGSIVGFDVDARGRAVVMLSTARDSSPVVARFASDGSLDSGFSGDGILRPAMAGVGARLAVQRSGAVLVGGKRGSNAILRRYRADGEADRGFGGKGRVVLTEGGPVERLLIQPGGQIVALATRTCLPSHCGYVYRNLWVKRLAPGGKLLHRYQLSEEAWQLKAVGMDARGGFIVAGHIWDLEYETYDRFRPSGAFERCICRDVKLTIHYEETDEEWEPEISDLAIDGEDRFLIALAFGDEIWRRNANGSADRTFGEGGRVECRPSVDPNGPFKTDPIISRVAVAADGKIVAAGGITDCGLVRYLPDGAPDPSFGGDGRVDVEAAGMTRPDEISLLPDGGVMGAGWDRRSGTLTLARYTAAGELDPDFGASGIAGLHVGDAG